MMGAKHMTPEIQRLNKKRKRLLARRARLPEAERTAINAEFKAVADQIALRVAVAQRATEQPLGPVVVEWVPTPNEPGEPEIVDLRNGRTLEDHLHERDGRVPRWPPDAA
jgi:hypothetical protein